ncbi:hypothetical protein HGM15179_005286, partial [Zosterops borbonicus]
VWGRGSEVSSSHCFFHRFLLKERTPDTVLLHSFPPTGDSPAPTSPIWNQSKPLLYPKPMAKKLNVSQWKSASKR